VNGRAGLWLDGVTWAGNDLRLELASAFLTSASASGSTGIAAGQGVRPGQGSPLLSTWTSGMSFTLNAGTCWVQGTASGTTGTYTATLDTTTTLIVPNGDPTNPRVDSVIAVVSDVGTSSSTTIFKILAGTPAGSPVHTALPANAVRLCDIAVAANASVLSAPNFTDLRPYIVAVGGILPYGNTTGATINGPVGTYVHDLATGRLKSLDGSGNARQPKVGAFAPVTTVAGNIVATSGSYAPVASASFTVDGVTEVEAVFMWQGYQSVGSAAVNDSITVYFNLDTQGGGSWSSQTNFTLVQTTTSSTGGSGGSFTAWITPAAGTHSIFVSARSNQANTYYVNNSTLRVRPSLG
jgi:hypothetical protein